MPTIDDPRRAGGRAAQRRQHAMLHGLNDHMLRDIGLPERGALGRAVPRDIHSRYPW